MSDESKSQSFWQTMPGMITAIAGLLTALTGMILALTQIGVFSGEGRAETAPTATLQVSIPAQTTSDLGGPERTVTQSAVQAFVPTKVPAPTEAPAPTQAAVDTPFQTSGQAPGSASGQLPKLPIALAAGGEAKAGDYVFKIVDARIDNHNSSDVALVLTMRMTNNDVYDANFWGSAFRLIVDGVKRAPDEAPNELVHAQSSKEAEVVFVIPDTVTKADLQVGQLGANTNIIPIDLSPAKPLFTSSSAGNTGGPSAESDVRFPSGPEAPAADNVYRILDARTESAGDGKIALQLTVRLTNNDIYDVILRGDRFRLLVDDTAFAPDEAPSELVKADSAKEARVVFLISDTVSRADLQVGQIGEKTNTIPLEIGR